MKRPGRFFCRGWKLAAETKPSFSAAPEPRKIPETLRVKRAGAGARSRCEDAASCGAGRPASRQRAGVGSRRQPPPPCLRHPRSPPRRAGSSFTQQTGLLYCKPFTNPQTCYKTATPGFFLWGENTRTHAHAQNMAGRSGGRRKEGEGGGEEDWRQVSAPQGRSVPFQASLPALPALSPPSSGGRG